MVEANGRALIVRVCSMPEALTSVMPTPLDTTEGHPFVVVQPDRDHDANFAEIFGRWFATTRFPEVGW
jgi:hypothetical protein